MKEICFKLVLFEMFLPFEFIFVVISGITRDF